MEWTMALIVSPNARIEAAEAEPVLVDVDTYNCRLVLDDGTEIHFDRDELERALKVPPGGERKAA